MKKTKSNTTKKQNSSSKKVEVKKTKSNEKIKKLISFYKPKPTEVEITFEEPKSFNEVQEQLDGGVFENEEKELVKEFIESNGILFIGLPNYENKICYFISMIQRFHSSQTLNELLQNKELTHDNPLYVLKIYSKLNQNNVNEISKEIKSELNYIFENVYSQNMLTGGHPFDVLKVILIPVLIKEFGIDNTKTILQEINLEPLNLNFKIEFDYQYFKDKTKEDEYRSLYKTNLNKLINYQPYSKNQFVIGNLFIYFNDENGNSSLLGGHSTNVIKGNDNEYYVIDDDVNIREISNYISSKQHRFNQLIFKDIDDFSIRELRNKLGKFENINSRIYKTIINYPSHSLTGGGEFKLNEDQSDFNLLNQFKQQSKINQVLSILTIVLFSILVVILIIKIIYKIYLDNKKEKYTKKNRVLKKKLTKIEKKYGWKHDKEEYQESKPNKFKEIIPDVVEVGLNFAEQHSLIDLVNKDLINKIVRKNIK